MIFSRLNVLKIVRNGKSMVIPGKRIRLFGEYNSAKEETVPPEFHRFAVQMKSQSLLLRFIFILSDVFTLLTEKEIVGSDTLSLFKQVFKGHTDKGYFISIIFNFNDGGAVRCNRLLRNRLGCKACIYFGNSCGFCTGRSGFGFSVHFFIAAVELFL